MKESPMTLEDRLKLAAQACRAAHLLSCEATCHEAATALSLAQTEIKGHMRVEEELKADNAELQKDNKLWHANWEAAHAEVQEARDFIVEQSKGNLGGGERPVEFLLASYKLMAHERTQAQARIAELEKDNKLWHANWEAAYAEKQVAEKALAEYRKPGKVYSTDQCEKHRGQSFMMTVTAAPYLYPTCPLCEQDETFKDRA